MNTQNINITASNIKGRCDLKCSYSFKYSESNSTAKNNGVMISITYDSSATPPVVYNEQKYNVGSIMITSPSIHLFDGETLAGELIVEHIPLKGGNNLNVCVPFTSSGDSTNSSQIITNIITTVASNAPSEGETTNLNMSDFSLQNIIPRKPFFTYSDGQKDWIVFGDLDAIPLSSSTITTLQQIIYPFPIPTPTADLFYNARGPTNGISIGDGLYISCQPTGSSTEETAVEYDKNPSSSVNFDSIINSKGFQIFIMIIIGIILCVTVFYGINAFYNYISSDSKKISIPTLGRESFHF